MKEFGKLLGFALIVIGIYWLGKNIILTTQSTSYGWQTIPAAGSVILMLAGLWTLFNAKAGNMGWILIGCAIALIFMSGGVMIRPTSLWTFLVGFSALFGGFKLIQA